MSDLIERQAAYDTLTGYYHHTTEIQHKALREALERVPSAETHEKRTETHACDCISRRAAIDAIVAQTIGYTVDEIKAECDENIFAENGYLGGLKDAIEAIEDISSAQPEVLACGEGELIAQPEIIRCKDCKHWKDSDGVYRRGINAESKCPVNIRAVYEGNFYCADAERRTDD